MKRMDLSQMNAGGKKNKKITLQKLSEIFEDIESAKDKVGS